MSHLVRVELPGHLCALAQVHHELSVTVEGPVTQRSVLDALEASYPTLEGTIRDHTSKLRRPFMRFFACQQDLSHRALDEELPEAVAAGAEPFLVIAAIAGGLSFPSNPLSSWSKSMKLNPYLNFAGNCKEAFEFYEEHLGGKILYVMTHEGRPLPPNSPAGWEKKILYAHMTLGETDVMGNDVPHAEPMRSVYLTFTIDSIEEAEKIHALLAEGGQIFMAMQETFFAFRFSMLRDRFGTSWMLLHPRPRP